MSCQGQLTELNTVSFEQRGKAAGLGACQSRGLSPPDGGRGSCLDSGGQVRCLQLRASRTEPGTATHRLPPGTHCLTAADAQSRLSQGRRQPQPPMEASFLPPGLVRPRLGPQPRRRSRTGEPPVAASPPNSRPRGPPSPPCRFSPGPGGVRWDVPTVPQLLPGSRRLSLHGCWQLWSGTRQVLGRYRESGAGM